MNSDIPTPTDPSPPPRTIKSKAVRSGIWTVFGFGGSQVLRLLGNLIMARLLVPDSFGVLAIANVILFGLVLFSDLGLKSSVVQSPNGDDETFLNTVWTIQILRGLILWAAALVAALVITALAGFGVFGSQSTYANAELPWVIAVLSFGSVLSGFESTRTSTAARHLQTGRLTILALVNQVVSLSSMVIIGLLTKSIWALVAASLISTAIQTLLSHTALPGKPNRILWNKPAAKEVLHFGSWVFFASILGFLASNGDRLILGGLLDTNQLGIYSIAFTMLSVVTDLLNRLLSGTTYPVLSETFRTDPTSLRRVYYRFRTMFDTVSLFLAGFLLVCGHLVIDFLYDSRYHDAGLFLQLMSLTLLESRFGLLNNAFLAMGKPKYFIPTILARILILFGFLAPVYHWGGVNAAVLLIGISTVLTVPVSLFLAHRNQLLDWKKELLFLPVFFVGLLAGWGADYVGKFLLPLIGLHVR